MLNLFDLLFPQRCIECKKFGSYLCTSCRGKLIPITYPICPVCAGQAIYGQTHPVCRGKYTPDGLVSVFRYTSPIRTLIRKLKYQPWLTDATKTIITLSMKSIPYNPLFERFLQTNPLITTIPLHWIRKWGRGYNQGELLGAELSNQWTKEYMPDLLNRTKYTKPQYKLTKKERIENIQNVFAPTEKLLYLSTKVRNILLLDDVWTTGSTLRNATNILKRNGVISVWAMTIAR